MAAAAALIIPAGEPFEVIWEHGPRGENSKGKQAFKPSEFRERFLNLFCIVLWRTFNKMLIFLTHLTIPFSEKNLLYFCAFFCYSHI